MGVQWALTIMHTLRAHMVDHIHSPIKCSTTHICPKWFPYFRRSHSSNTTKCHGIAYNPFNFLNSCCYGTSHKNPTNHFSKAHTHTQNQLFARANSLSHRSSPDPSQSPPPPWKCGHGRDLRFANGPMVELVICCGCGPCFALGL